MNKNKIGQITKLNQGQRGVCRVLAKKRYANNRQEGVTNSKRGNQSNWETDLEGIGAEFAFCALFNTMPDMSIQTRSSQNREDEDGDATLSNGQTVDIKTTKYPTGKLIAVPWKKSNVDLYALMVGEFPEYEFKGFMKSEELIKDSRIGNLGYGDTYIAQQQELKELEELQQ